MSNKKEETQPELEILHTKHGDYKTTLTAKYKNRTPWHPKDPRQVFSFIPGTIMTIDVKVGDTVKVGDVLLTFKAMKMHNTYKSPVDGKVAKIHVSPDEIVPKGVLVLEFE